MEGREVEGRGGEVREEGGGKGVGAPFNFLLPGATDFVTPLHQRYRFLSDRHDVA